MTVSAGLAKIRMMIWVETTPNVASDTECVRVEETFLSCRFTYASWFDEATSFFVYHDELLFMVTLLPPVRSSGGRNEEKRQTNINLISHQWLDNFSCSINMLKTKWIVIFYVVSIAVHPNSVTHIQLWKFGITGCIVWSARTSGWLLMKVLALWTPKR